MESFEDAIEQALTSHAKNPSDIIWLGDGAKGFWHVAERVAPEAVQILDWYHVMEHASECAKTFFDRPELIELWRDSIAQALLDPARGIDAVLADLESCSFEAENDAELAALSELRRYYRTNKKRMEYHRYRSEGWPIGSGAIESAHRHVIQTRMKRAGQHWSTKVANQMAKMRAMYAATGHKRLHAAVQEAYQKTMMAA